MTLVKFVLFDLNLNKIEKCLVTKSNDLNEARYRLTTTEQKILLSLIARIKLNDVDFEKLVGVSCRYL